MAERTLMFRTSVSAISKASPEAVYDTIADLRAHLEWSGQRASDDKFKLLSLEAPGDPATVGTTFTSSGAAENGTFHDRSVVTEASRPHRFVIETDSRLERRRGRTWEVHFSHRYDIEPEGDGSRILYTETAERANYVPYWLHPLIRPIFRPYVTAPTASSSRTSRVWPKSVRPAEHRGRSFARPLPPTERTHPREELLRGPALVHR